MFEEFDQQIIVKKIRIRIVKNYAILIVLTRYKHHYCALNCIPAGLGIYFYICMTSCDVYNFDLVKEI